MVLRVSLREANQHFSRHVKSVETGDVVVIPRRGTPVARLISEAAVRHLSGEQIRARDWPRERPAQGYRLGVDRLDRGLIHERSTRELRCEGARLRDVKRRPPTARTGPLDRGGTCGEEKRLGMERSLTVEH